MTDVSNLGITGTVDSSYQVLVYSPNDGETTRAPLTVTGAGLVASGSVGAPGTGGGSGNVSNSGTPAAGQIAQWADATHVVGLGVTGTGIAVLATNPTLSNPIVGTQSPGDNTTKAASTAFVNTALSNVNLAQTSQTVVASGATLTIDMNLGWCVALTLSANVTTFNVLNWPTSTILGRLILDITSNGAFNITGWPGLTIWPAGSAPTITSGAGKKDTIILTSAGGSNFRGFIGAQNMS